MKLFQPEVFQGHLNQRHYFEGWYFKHVAGDGKQVLSVIPGVALTDDDPHAFIQVLNGTTAETWNIRFPLSDCHLSTSALEVRIGTSTFSAHGIHLDIDRPELKLFGDLTFRDMVRFPSSWIKPGIMGPFTFVPRMECKHGVVSIRHSVAGSLNLNCSILTFDNGTGYIEKDWGRSFPESWIWVQGNTFGGSDASFMFSLARVPWLGRSFMGFVCYFYVAGRPHYFTSYSFSKIRHISFANRELMLEIENMTHVVRCTVTQKTSGQLKAPVIGKMDRLIKESADSDISLVFMDRSGQNVFKGEGTHAGLEVIEEIFKHLSPSIRS